MFCKYIYIYAETTILYKDFINEKKKIQNTICKHWSSNRKHYISLTIRPRTTKIERVVTLGGETLPSKSRNLLTLRLHDPWKALYLGFRITYSSKTWQLVIQVKGTPPTKSSGHVISWKTENLISTLPQNLWQPNLAGSWLRVGT